MPTPIHTLRSGSSFKAASRLTKRQRYFSARTGRRRGTGTVERTFPEVPPTWPGSEPEWAIFWAHGQIGLKEGEDFEYIPRLGRVMGNVKGVQVDFFEFDMNVAIDIQGLFWHYGFSAAKQHQDAETRIRIESFGYTYIAIDEDDAMREPIFYLREARGGRDYSRAARGVV